MGWLAYEYRRFLNSYGGLRRGRGLKWPNSGLRGVVVIRSPHDPEVPSSNPGKNNTSDFSIRDPLSLPSCDWYRIYLAMWWSSSVGRAADLIFTC